MEVSILMPCLNEASSLGFCIVEAKTFLETHQIEGEVLIADNGSTDGSRFIAESLGARVVSVSERGYGAALRGGIAAARGDYVIMGDSDGSYDFSNLQPFLQALRQGAELVVGNRYQGQIERGAFPLSHRYLGVPALSFLGRLAADCEVFDFHCGLRAVRKSSFLTLNTACAGMEFASEMILLASHAGQRIVELPADLRRDRRIGHPHLRAIPDGMRHLHVILHSWRGGKQKRE